MRIRALALCPKSLNLVALVLMFGICRQVAAAPDAVIPYQGSMELGGVPADGVYAITFFLYSDGGSPGAPIWSEAQVVDVRAGQFFALLGADSGNPLPDGFFTLEEIFLGLEVEGEPLVGRQQIHSLPWAFEAARARDFEVIGDLEIQRADGNPVALTMGPSGLDAVPQVWRLSNNVNRGSFALVDVSNGNKLPLQVQMDAPTNSLFVASNGMLGLGTSTPLIGLDLRRSDGDAIIRVRENHATVTSRTLLLLENQGPARLRFTDRSVDRSWQLGMTDDGLYFNLMGSGQTEFEIYDSGDVHHLGSLLHASDARLKRDVVQLSDALDRVRALSGVSYLRRGGAAASGREIGLIAQDVEQVYPEAVRRRDDGYLAVSYTALVGALVESTKELDAHNKVLLARQAAQQKRVDALEAELEALRQQVAELAAAR